MSKKRVYLVTGATGAIGAGIVSLLAECPEHEVILLAREETKALSLIQTVSARKKQAQLRYLLADLSDKSSIYALASAWEGPLDVLINNAAAAPRTKQITKEGLEFQFSLNVLSYLRLSEALRPVLKNSKRGRIINVASYWAGGLDLEDLQFKTRRYNNDAAYRQSKQANRMLTRIYAELFAADGISVNACHPGDVNSRLSNDLGFGGHQSPESGAETPAFLAQSDAVSFASGKYYEHLAEVPCPFMQNLSSCEALYLACREYL